MLVVISIIVLSIVKLNLKPEDKKTQAGAPTPVLQLNTEQIMGTWFITKHVGSARYSTYSKEDIEKLIGKKIVYRMDAASFNNKPVKPPYYKSYMQSEKEFFEWYYIKLSKIGTKAKEIQVIEVYKDKEFKSLWGNVGNTVMVKDKENLILYDGGEFFLLTKKK